LLQVHKSHDRRWYSCLCNLPVLAKKQFPAPRSTISLNQNHSGLPCGVPTQVELETSFREWHNYLPSHPVREWAPLQVGLGFQAGRSHPEGADWACKDASVQCEQTSSSTLLAQGHLYLSRLCLQKDLIWKKYYFSGINEYHSSLVVQELFMAAVLLQYIAVQWKHDWDWVIAYMKTYTHLLFKCLVSYCGIYICYFFHVKFLKKNYYILHLIAYSWSLKQSWFVWFIAFIWFSFYVTFCPF